MADSRFANPDRETEHRELDRVRSRLLDDFTPHLPDGLVLATMAAAVAELSDARVRLYVPLLVERSARTRLRNLVASGAATPSSLVIAS